MALIYVKKDHIAYLTINRPEARNALDRETMRELSSAWLDVRDNKDVWVAILTGAGDKSFCAGSDMAKTPDNAEASIRQDVYWSLSEVPNIHDGIDLWKPVIAAVNGYCLGAGMTMLLATDIRIAAEHAEFGVPEARWGLLPGSGGTQRLLRQIPYTAAMELMLTGDRISASEAWRIGLVNRVVPGAELMAAAQRIAERLCENSPTALRAIKELAIRSQSVPLEHGIRYERAVAGLLIQGEDYQEGLRAFQEKRKPAFRSR